MANVGFQITADTAEAIKAIQGFAEASSKSLEGLEGAVEFLKFEKIGELAYKAFEKISEGIHNVIDKASESEAAFNRMAVSMKVAGDYSGQNVKAFEELALNLSKTSKFDEDVILSQVALAKSFGLTNKEAARLVQASVELSTVTGKDLNTSVEQLGRTYEGSAGRLAKTIPGLNSLTEAQLRAGGAAELIIKNLGGTAAGSLETFEGQTTQSAHAAEAFEKSLGKIFTTNQVTMAFLKEVTKIFEDLTAYVNENKGALKSLVSDGILVFVDSLGVMTQMLAIADDVLSKIYVGFRIALDAAVAFAKFQSGADVTAPLKLLNGELDKYSSTVDALNKRAGVYDGITERLAGIHNTLSSVREEQDKVTASVEETNDGFDNQTTKIQRVSQELINQFNEIKKHSQDFGETKLQQIDNEYVRQIKTIADAVKFKITSETEAAKIIDKLTEENNQKRHELNKKNYQEEEQFLKKLVANPLSYIYRDKQDGAQPYRFDIGDPARAATATGVGGLTTVLGGANGAQSFISGIADAAGQALIGVPGFGKIIDILSQGPDAVKGLIDGFAKQIPVIIKAIADSIPVVIKTILDDLPDIIESLTDALPEIIDSLVEHIPDILEKLAEKLPDIAFRLTLAAIAPVPTKMLEGAVKFVGKILEGAAQFVGKFIESIGQLVGEMLQGAVRFVQAIVDGAGQFVGQILQGAVNFVSQIISGAGQFIQHLISQIPGLGGGGGGGGLLGGRVIPGILKASNADENATSSSVQTQAALPGTNVGNGSSIYNEELGRLTGYGMSAARDANILRRRAQLERQGIDPLAAARAGQFKAGADGSQATSSETLQPIQIRIGEQQLAAVMYSLTRRGFRTS